MASKMGKIIKFVLIGILFLIIVLVLLFKFQGGRIIASAAEVAGTKALNVAVGIDGVGIQPFTGSGAINGLSIANPAGFNEPYLMKMQQGQVKINIKSLFDDTVIIEKVYLDDLHITFEQKGLSSNIQVITDGLKQPDKQDTGKDTPEKDHKAKKVVISDLQIVNAKLSIKLLPIPGRLDTVTIPLPDITMKDVGKGDKLEFSDVVELIFVKISETIATAGTGVIPDDLLGSLNDSISGAIGAIGDIGGDIFKAGGGIIEGGTDAGKAITETATKTLEGIGNIFGGKKTEQKEE